LGRERQQDLVAHRHEQVDVAADGLLEERVDRRTGGARRVRVDGAVTGIPRTEAGASGVVVGRDDVHAAAAEGADERDRAAARGVGDEDARGAAHRRSAWSRISPATSSTTAGSGWVAETIAKSLPAVAVPARRR